MIQASGINILIAAMSCLTAVSLISIILGKQRFYLLFLLGISFWLCFFNQSDVGLLYNFFYYFGVAWSIYGIIPFLIIPSFFHFYRRAYKNNINTGIRNWDLYLLPIWGIIICPFSIEPFKSGVIALWVLMSFLLIEEIIGSYHKIDKAFFRCLVIYVIISLFFLVWSVTVSTPILSIRYHGMMKDSAVMGIVCITGLSSCMALIHMGRLSRMNTFIVIMVMILFVVFAIYSQSRSFMLSSGIISLYYIWCNRKKWGNQAALLLLLIGTFIIVGYLPGGFKAIFSPVKQRIEHASIELKPIGKSSGRGSLWKTYIKFIAKNPEVGTGGWVLSSKQIYSDVRGYYKYRGTGTHNIFLEYMLVMGITGVILFLIILVRSLLNLKKWTNKENIRQSILILFGGNLIAALFDSPTTYPISAYFWTLWTPILFMRQEVTNRDI